MSNDIRVRFAPSPTGYLHVGGARTALFNYLFAKKHNGTFVLRIEDTDVERSTEESMRMQIRDLHWLGLRWDEGIHPETLQDMGEYGPYRQSQRLDIYKKYADQLLSEGKAYYCFLTDEEISQQRELAQKEGRPPQVQSPYRNLPLDEAKQRLSQGESAVVRLKTPDEKRDYVLNDLVRNEVVFPSDMVGDFVLLRSSGMPVYNFCCAVDDALMKISHVFRAEEHLSNTLRQMMIYEGLGFKVPQFGHFSIILGQDRQKLSKRHGATSIKQYEDMGYLPEAMNNFLALLGWSHPDGKEILSLEELKDSFATDRVNSAPAVFDEQKLKWVNSMHLRALPNDELWARLQPFFDKEGLKLPDDRSWQHKALEVYKSNMELLTDGPERFRPLSEQGFALSEAAQEVLAWESSKTVISAWQNKIAALNREFLTEEQFGQVQNEIKDECGVKGKFLFMPIRVAVIGEPQGAELKILVPLLKSKVLLERAQLALSKA